ncbi:stage III sporulation protein AE [Alkalibacillus almallahensis]|uniref:stage III sporulation protein AE n=1 Tax=Alkalibacillus almallahensis TaxID=1379154 RepID=UPI0014225F18|nr:stage III sporulation protein AE [Alkalibacillus almallahensis]NIK12417.1 stage III sporulation protein AE [Alkalibacillus almallahensis]
MKKTVISLLIVAIMISLTDIQSIAEDEGEELDQNEVEEDLEGFFESPTIENQWQDLLNEYRDYMPLDSGNQWRDITDEESIFSWRAWVDGIVSFLIDELLANGQTLSLLIFITLLSAVLNVLAQSFETQTVTKVSQFVIFGVLMTIAMTGFHTAANFTTDTIETMRHFMVSLLPLFLSMMAAFGHVATVAFFNPFILFLTQASGLFVAKIIIPLLFLSAILHIASHVNETYNLSRLAHLFKQGALLLMGAFLSVFLTIMSVQGITTAASDGVAVRAAKFVTSNFIPVIGRMFTDATDTVLSASILVKNTIGVAGLVVLFVMILFPILKVLVLGLVFRLAAAILQPVADGPVVHMVDDMGKHILYLLLALLMVSIMFFFSIVMLIVISNTSLMVR